MQGGGKGMQGLASWRKVGAMQGLAMWRKGGEMQSGGKGMQGLARSTTAWFQIGAKACLHQMHRQPNQAWIH